MSKLPNISAKPAISILLAGGGAALLATSVPNVLSGEENVASSIPPQQQLVSEVTPNRDGSENYESKTPQKSTQESERSFVKKDKESVWQDPLVVKTVLGIILGLSAVRAHKNLMS